MAVLLGGFSLQASPVPYTWASTLLVTESSGLAGMTTDKDGNVYGIRIDEIVQYKVQGDPANPRVLAHGDISSLVVDDIGNLYYTEQLMDTASGSSIWQIQCIPIDSAPGTPPRTVYTAAPSELLGYLAVARDGSRLYFVDHAKGQIHTASISGGSLQDRREVDSPFPSISAIAVDDKGNLFVADPGNQIVWLLEPSAGSYLPRKQVAGNLPIVKALAADGGFIHAIEGNRLLRFRWNGKDYDSQQVAGELENPEFLGVDGKGIIRIAEHPMDGSSRILKLSSRFQDTPKGASSAEVMQVSFTFDADTEISSFDVLMKGAPHKAFLDAGSGSLNQALQDAATNKQPSVTIRTGETRTVDVTFAPGTPGLKMGAVVLRGPDGNAVRTAYVQGSGTGSQLVFLPSAATAWTSPGELTYPWHQDVDGVGRLYVTDQRTCKIKRWDPQGNQLTAVVDKDKSPGPMGLALDGAGNVYWGRNGDTFDIVINEPINNEPVNAPPFNEKAFRAGTQAYAVTADGKGNIYYVNGDRTTCTRLTRNPDGTLTPIRICDTSKLPQPSPILGIAVDGDGDLFLSSGDVSAGFLWKMAYSPRRDAYEDPLPVNQANPSMPGFFDFALAPSGAIFGSSYFGREPKTTYMVSPDGTVNQLPFTDITAIIGAAMSDDGSLFLSDMGAGRCLKYEAVSGELTFPATPVQATSDPAPLRISNNGTQPLTFGPPEVAAPFSLVSSIPPTMEPGAILGLSLTFQPTQVPVAPQGLLEGTLVLKDDGGASSIAHLRGSAQQAKPVLNWNAPAFTFNKPLTLEDLTATATCSGVPVQGTFSLILPANTALSDGTRLQADTPLNPGFHALDVGAQRLRVDFKPDDPQSFADASQLFWVMVNKAAPTFAFDHLEAPYSGSPQAPSVTTDPPGLPVELKYTHDSDAPSPSATEGGVYKVEAVVSTPKYQGSATRTFTITPATPTIDWTPITQVSYGRSLANIAPNATSTVPGTFAFLGDAASIPEPGQYSLNAVFTPSNPANYSIAKGAATLQVNPATPVIAWLPPTTLVHGEALSRNHLNAMANVAGTFTYNHSVGEILNAGKQNLSVTFTPEDTRHYGTATLTRSLTVQKAKPSITWTHPAPIAYGEPLGKAQLNATATLEVTGAVAEGTFTYDPPAGTLLDAGLRTLTVTFTPADPANVESPSPASPLKVSLEVLKAPASLVLKDLNQAYTGAPRTVSVATQPDGLSVTVTYDGATSAPSAPGTYAVVATVSDPNHQGSASGTLTIAPAAPTGTLTLQATGNAHAGDPVVLTATFSNPAAFPGAPITFHDGDTLLGWAFLVNGKASFTASNLAAGVHAFHASLETDSGALLQDSGEVSTPILPATLTLALESQALTVKPGETLHTGFTLTALGRATGPVHLSASGLPPGLTLTFSANDLDPAKLPANLTVDLQAAPSLAFTHAGRLANLDFDPFGNLGTGLLAMGLLAAPFAGWRRRRRILPWLGGFALVLAAGLTGCHQGAPASQVAPAPIPPAPPTTYSILITAHADGMDDVNIPLGVTVNHETTN